MTAGWNRREAGLFLLALAWLALTLGARPLALPDEGRYVSVAWEMLTSGNWLFPTLDGLPFFHKPPLFYWITAGSLGLFGTHEWASRLASRRGRNRRIHALRICASPEWERHGPLVVADTGHSAPVFRWRASLPTWTCW